MSVVAVVDMGKTNVKLMAMTPEGRLVEAASLPNVVRPGPPFRHHDLAGIEDWLLDALGALHRRHPVAAVVAAGHGSGGVLVGDDGPAMPMIDYEQDVPPEVERDYRALVGPFRERGSAVMLGAAHTARQMLWLERGWPDAFAKARAFLALPQYWSWRLSGVLAGEVTSLAAQSHLWSPADGRPARLVAARRWERLMPPMRRAFETLGPPTPAVAARTGLPPSTRILCGIHDSSANVYRYAAAGFRDMTVVSTGTWIVALTDRAAGDVDTERPGFSCNADILGRPVPGMLTMGGREFSAVAGAAGGPASREALGRIVASLTLALPSFGPDDGLFPGTARRGRLEGPLRDEPDVRFTLAVLYAALLTTACAAGLPRAGTLILDGSFVADPLYGALVAALNPDRRVLVNADPHGTAAGAALLAGHETRTAPAPLDLVAPRTAGLPDLSLYLARWHERSKTMETIP